MSNLLEKIKEKAGRLNKTIVLPEGDDSRVLEAVKIIEKEKIAKVIVLKKDDKRDLEKYAKRLFEIRKEKGLSLEEARELVKKPMYLGVLMVEMGEADGLVAGACHSTSEMLRPGLQIVKTAKGIKTVSSCFIMVMQGRSSYGDSGVMVFGDCAVNIEPTEEQLADIAIASSETAVTIAGIKVPKVAMLSFSTKCSAKHPFVDKVNRATDIVHEKAPSLLVDGDLQLDAAIECSVAKLKAPKSEVAGYANVLIFPDLQSGNIGYKLVERLAGAEAIGPICQGFRKPLNDLSRGCSVSDIVNVVAITALQAKNSSIP